MKTKRQSARKILQVCLLIALVFPGGCSRNTRALFTKPELSSYERLAVFGLQPEQEQIFMACYIRTFPGRLITFIERAQLRATVREQDLLAGRLDERTRARMKKILGVEALIMCEYYPAQESRTDKLKLRVRVVDSETGAIVGSVVTEGYSRFEDHAWAAAQALREDLLSGRHREYRNSRKAGSQ
jgi:hypothetical protein